MHYLDELTDQEIRAFRNAVERAAGKIEHAVLRVIAQGSGSFGPGECFWSFGSIAEETGLSREYVRAACRSLTDQGLAEYSAALSNEDGDFRGAGYGATRAGIAHLDGTGTERDSVVRGVIPPDGEPQALEK